MPFIEKNGLRYFQFANLPSTVTHAIFTRQGGLSPAPWNSLNIGGSVGDDPAHVSANRIRVFEIIGRDPESVFDVWQVHGTRASFALEPRHPNSHEDKADLIFTDRPEITLYMRFADCTPLLFVDTKKNVVGLAHAGWQGTVQGVATAAVKAMQERYNSKLEDIHAAIGPAIGPDHYEVGDEVISQVQAAFGADAEKLLPRVGERRHFDLWAANRLQLEKAGVTKIETAEICTMCNPADWFSHRGEKGKTGRFGALIALKE
ncbi:MAG: peptidoglycan editing factor PgeF [Anaerolineae bacterium]|mgnify:CR=1 FL=1|jgi:polyphenol oxidase|nr:peptidoglycan editing factor PgeF [Anaerolineae bacterium]MBT7070356.1 peptidoglycan editing factor PgeF [Anaerolineae bacterium]MBT7324398.1 peptidoglycan editing factor PgeF [Anaerolineae bacterium]